MSFWFDNWKWSYGKKQGDEALQKGMPKPILLQHRFNFMFFSFWNPFGLKDLDRCVSLPPFRCKSIQQRTVIWGPNTWLSLLHTVAGLPAAPLFFPPTEKNKPFTTKQEAASCLQFDETYLLWGYYQETILTPQKMLVIQPLGSYKLGTSIASIASMVSPKRSDSTTKLVYTALVSLKIPSEV